MYPSQNYDLKLLTDLFLLLKNAAWKMQHNRMKLFLKNFILIFTETFIFQNFCNLGFSNKYIVGDRK